MIQCFLKNRLSERTTERVVEFPDRVRRIELPNWAWRDYDVLVNELPDDPMSIAYNAATTYWTPPELGGGWDFEDFLLDSIRDAIVHFSATNDNGIESE